LALVEGEVKSLNALEAGAGRHASAWPVKNLHRAAEMVSAGRRSEYATEHHVLLVEEADDVQWLCARRAQQLYRFLNCVRVDACGVQRLLLGFVIR
jgi:hypothetical protein